MEKEELDKIRRALLCLAVHLERCPYNEYKISQEIMDILEVELVSKEVK